jgi:hypothetical protein
MNDGIHLETRVGLANMAYPGRSAIAVLVEKEFHVGNTLVFSRLGKLKVKRIELDRRPVDVATPGVTVGLEVSEADFNVVGFMKQMQSSLDAAVKGVIPFEGVRVFLLSPPPA